MQKEGKCFFLKDKINSVKLFIAYNYRTLKLIFIIALIALSFSWLYNSNFINDISNSLDNSIKFYFYSYAIFALVTLKLLHSVLDYIFSQKKQGALSNRAKK